MSAAALEIAREALEGIALAVMSVAGQESEEGMRDWHARRAWQFISISALAKIAIYALATEAVVEPAQEVCAQAYQVVGSLLSDMGLFETEHARKILDNLSEARMVHEDLLPWPSFAIHAAENAPPKLPTCPDAVIQAISAYGDARADHACGATVDTGTPLGDCVKLIRLLMRAADAPHHLPDAGNMSLAQQAQPAADFSEIDFSDPRVQVVYELLVDSETWPPEGEHWEGFVARRIVAALTHHARPSKKLDRAAIIEIIDSVLVTGENVRHNGELWYRSQGRQYNVRQSDLVEIIVKAIAQAGGAA